MLSVPLFLLLNLLKYFPIAAQRIELKGAYKIIAISDKLLSGAEMYMDWDNSMFKPEYIKFDQLFDNCNCLC
ncbi:hypothetical protein COC54_24150 [Bacillus pseudomycoides]|nr:hypothetical protein CN564_09530 [Bacillus pseudomycoides]PGR98053.1 hypothetical protein COC54_24150 [Bacillus pseudomycoides]PHC86560.1 hypothetical protein COF36_24145 [Bacillus pseudomycoides]